MVRGHSSVSLNPDPLESSSRTIRNMSPAHFMENGAFDDWLQEENGDGSAETDSEGIPQNSDSDWEGSNVRIRSNKRRNGPESPEPHPVKRQMVSSNTSVGNLGDGKLLRSKSTSARRVASDTVH
jgi:hypothetical protein